MLDIAKQYNLDKIDTLSNKDIKIAVIKKVNGDFNIDNKSEEYIDGMFDVCSEQQINIDSASASKRRIINGDNDNKMNFDDFDYIKKMEELKQAEANAYKGE